MCSSDLQFLNTILVPPQSLHYCELEREQQFQRTVADVLLLCYCSTSAGLALDSGQFVIELVTGGSGRTQVGSRLWKGFNSAVLVILILFANPAVLG